ncbi:hypothetical protein [Sphaerisporangium sp. TRM90804]|uniref:hypothetical protein n=1 Tax=Sphaerisporangium sp. TRM90804 TaxID=3031113 RepID=UPI0024469834|nr:hypothetical protein [Sphaerisporangium sp. TRM90804]MDH2428018.1 hypothetical protein [Sphaerisporangium sp. TRM90804]
MPSQEHEAMILLFRNRSELAAELLGKALGVAVPAYEKAVLAPGDLTECPPVEYQADAVVVLSDGDPVLAVVVEVQRHRDPRKRWSWPVYLASMRARVKCPAILLVICTDATTAAWCAKSIDMGHPGWRLAPPVAGPEAVPVVVDPGEAARAPELAVLSAVAHGGGLDAPPILEALLDGLASVDEDRARLYADFVLMTLPEVARKHMEVLMAAGTYEYQSDFAKKYVAHGKAEGKAEGRAEGKAEGRIEGKAEGKVEGKAEAVILILSGRGIWPSVEVRDRVLACTDVWQLDEWIKRAANAEEAEDLFV